MKVKDVWLGIFIFLLVIFFGLYFSSKTGYYETEEKNKTILTLEQIKAFETDVQNGAVEAMSAGNAKDCPEKVLPLPLLNRRDVTTPDP